ncbi:MAG: hypothetical protein ACXABY_30610 [Candidatus Thorarchaeota archaeon]|jgi:hypothetical protein
MVEAAEKVSESVEDLPTLPDKRLLSGGCIVHKMVGEHGPYAYHVKKVNGKQTWTYLGKSSSYQTKAQGLVNEELTEGGST